MRAIFTCECFLLSFFCLFAHEKKRNGKKKNWSFTSEKKKQKMKYNEKELNKKKKLLALERKNRIWEWLLSCVSMTREEKKLRKAYWKKKKSQERRSLSFFFFFLSQSGATHTA